MPPHTAFPLLATAELCMWNTWNRVVRDQEVVEKCGDVVENRFGIQEEFCEEREVLRVEFVL